MSNRRYSIVSDEIQQYFFFKKLNKSRLYQLQTNPEKTVITCNVILYIPLFDENVLHELQRLVGKTKDMNLSIHSL